MRLRRAIPAALASLAVGGRIVVMSYQSLEDRIVKQALAVGAHPDVPHGLPVIPDSMKPWLRLLTRGGEVARTRRDRGESSSGVGPRSAGRLGVAA